MVLKAFTVSAVHYFARSQLNILCVGEMMNIGVDKTKYIKSLGCILNG